MPVIAIPRILREKLGEEIVDSLIELFNKSEERVKSDVIVLSEEKFERRLTEETSKLDKRITEEVSKVNERITEVETKLDRRITEEVSKLRVEIKSNYASTIRWMFIFYLGQVASIIGVLFAFFKR
ncbi:MAG: hypothetical protein AB1297_09565 [bacterium]